MFIYHEIDKCIEFMIFIGVCVHNISNIYPPLFYHSYQSLSKPGGFGGGSGWWTGCPLMSIDDLSDPFEHMTFIHMTFIHWSKFGD